MTILSAAQVITLRADIAANQNTVLISGVPTAISAVPNSSDNNYAIAAWYNLQATPAFYGNYKSVPLLDIKNALTFKNFTPTDPVPTDTALNVAIHQARTLLCQSYQININNLLTASTTIDATKSNIVQGLKDVTNNVPAGVAGANVSGGWSAIQKILCRTGSNLEKLFADTSGGTGADNTHAATFVFEGAISLQDISDLRAS